jgi:hypothetical protein
MYDPDDPTTCQNVDHYDVEDGGHYGSMAECVSAESEDDGLDSYADAKTTDYRAVLRILDR